jgi:DNA mismatch repair ATPase MutS
MTDLGIFGARNGSSIYDLYNQTHTSGGEIILKDLFLHPLSDREEINRRSAIIAYFAGLGLTFPFDAVLFDMAEKYMAHGYDQTKQAAQHGLTGEKEIRQGVTAVIALIQKLQLFIEKPELIALADYKKERAAMAAILAAPAFEPVRREKPEGKIAYTALTAYDVLFRQQEYQQVKSLLGHIYHLDVYLSVAKLAAERKFVFPRALDTGKPVLKLEGVYHPELKKPIGNDVSMTAQQNLVFLTGANMAGKSTFLRSVSTAVYLAHIGFPVAARRMEFSVMEGLYTTVNLPDNLGMGASHFYNEVLRVKKIAAALNEGRSLFVVFDELFRGTNVKDAHEATVAVSKGFADNSNSLFIISSHIVEAGEDLRSNSAVSFRYLPTRMKGHIPEYTYTLEEGITDDRHGMIIIRNEGILDILENGQVTKKQTNSL